MLNNIEDTSDGACLRYKNLREKYDKVPECFFLVADLGNDLETGDAFKNADYRDLYSSLWNPNVEYNTNFKDKKFHIVSCMFALNYFTNMSSRFNNFIKNVDDNLLPGGFFVGSCFDGMSIFNLLKEIPKGMSIKGYKGGSIIWSLIKNYNYTQFKNDETSLGYPIKVLISSINQRIIEFLVNFDYLVSKLAEKNIELLTLSEASEMQLTGINQSGYSSSGLFDGVFEMLNNYRVKDDEYKYAKSILENMTTDEKNLSFLNRFFIFRKKDMTLITDEPVEDLPIKKKKELRKKVSSKKTVTEDVVNKEVPIEISKDGNIIVETKIKKMKLEKAIVDDFDSKYNALKKFVDGDIKDENNPGYLSPTKNNVKYNKLLSIVRAFNQKYGVYKLEDGGNDITSRLEYIEEFQKDLENRK